MAYNIDVFCKLMSIPMIPLWLQFLMIGLAVVWVILQQLILRLNKFTLLEDLLERWYLKTLAKNNEKENAKLNRSKSSE